VAGRGCIASAVQLPALHELIACLAAATQTDYGQRVRLVGNQPFLGNWDGSKGPSLKWGQGHVWSATINVPVGVDVDFKVRLCLGPC
jgi:hypothetical protein